MIETPGMAQSTSEPPAAASRGSRAVTGAWATGMSRLLWAGSAVICLVLSLYVLRRGIHSVSDDSWYPMECALAFLRGPHAGLVYDHLFFGGHIKFQYPLTALLPLDLLGRIGIAGAMRLNTINAVVLILLGIVFAAFSRKILGPVSIFGIRLPVGPLAFLAALLYFPDHLAFTLGQIQLLLDLLFLLACMAVLYRRPLLAGCLIGASALVKPQFALFGLLALWRRDWRFALGFGAVGILCALLSSLLYGLRQEFDYLPVLTFLSHHGEWVHMNQSVNGLMLRFLYHGPSLDLRVNGPILQSALPPFIPAVYVTTLLSSLVMMAVPFLMPSRPDDVLSALLRFCVAGILFTMASPVAWTHHYGVLLPAYAVALKVILERAGGAAPAGWLSPLALGLSFLLTGLALGPAVGHTIPALNIPQSHVFFGACILVAVLLAEHRFRRKRAVEIHDPAPAQAHA